MKPTTLLLVAFALASCERTAAPGAPSRDRTQGATPKAGGKSVAVERPDPNHKYLVQPVVPAPPAVINAEGETIVHADPAVLFKGTELDHGAFRVDDPGHPPQAWDSIELLKPEFRGKPGVPIEGRFGLSGAGGRP